jgi:1,2-diacylglycerol 3-beta-galactosyltransferase
MSDQGLEKMAIPKRILIFTTDSGFGHRNAAKAVLSAIQEKYGDTVTAEIVNPLDDKRIPGFIREAPADYDCIVRGAPDLYRIGYDASDVTVTIRIVESAITVVLYELLRDLINSFKPDAILSTYPLYQAPLSAIFTIQRQIIPILVSITDLADVHRMWFNGKVDSWLVANQGIRDLAMTYKIPPSKIQITGIPVNPDVVREKRTKEELRHSLNWDPHLLTLLAVGSRRVDNMVDSLNIINHFGAPLQVAIVAGKDENLYQQLKAVEWHIPVHIYDYVDNMPPLMLASDAILSKAGGLIVTEALACKLPMLIIDAIPGQELGNARYITTEGAGDWVKSPLETLETLAHWLKDDLRLLRERTSNAARLGLPYAAYTVADLLYEAALVGPIDTKGKRVNGRSRLVELLKRNKVPLQDKNSPEEDIDDKVNTQI